MCVRWNCEQRAGYPSLGFRADSPGWRWLFGHHQPPTQRCSSALRSLEDHPQEVTKRSRCFREAGRDAELPEESAVNRRENEARQRMKHPVPLHLQSTGMTRVNWPQAGAETKWLLVTRAPGDTGRQKNLQEPSHLGVGRDLK